MATKVQKKTVQTQYSKLARNASSKVSSVFRNEESINLLNQFKAGDTRLIKYDRVENTVYDPRWIEEIEDCLYDLGLIVQNPKRVTQEVTDVVPVELARKTNAQSVIHLATHSQYVKEMKENGDIIPNKILNIGSDDFLQTYENRFIATLIRRLVLFVEKRYQFLEENVNVKKTQVLMMKNKSIIDGREVEIETKVKISADDIVNDEQINLNKSYITRVKELKRYLLYYYNSPFMKEMHTEKNVRNPILMTNIIRKNPLYNHCYRLYRFIDKYDLMGVEYKVNEKYDSFDEKKLEQINKAFLLSFLSVGPDETIRKVKRNKKRSFKPHIESNTDDDIFLFGPYYKGPLEFVRADEEFRKYLDNSKYVVPPHLTKREREYWGAEIEENKATMEEMLEVAKLLRRKNKEYKVANKEFDRIENERLKEEALAQAREELQRENNVLSEFEKARQELILAALKANGSGIIPNVDKQEEKPQEEVVKQERVDYDNVIDTKLHKIKSNEFVPFSKRIENSDKSLSDAYKAIRHEALCYGLKSRISRTSDTFRLHNMTYLKIAQVGKSLKIHYALDPKAYENSPIPVKDESGKVSYANIPLLFKVRSDLSVKRAISLIHDLAKKYGLEYREITPKEEKLATITENEKVEEKPQNSSQFASFANHKFVPFSKRIENSDVSLSDAYKAIRHEALCYGLKSRISKTSDTFRLHNVTYLKIAQVGKSLKIHYALDPKDYENSPITVKDESGKVSYANIPLLFKVRSDLSVRRAILLIKDLANKYGLEYKEITPEEEELATVTEGEKVEEKPQISSPFASFTNHEFVPFSRRIENSDASLSSAYKAIRHEALCYGLKSRISKTSDTFRLHNVTYLKIAQVGKSLKIHYALDPKDYENSPIPVKDESGKVSYVNIPLLFKVRSDLSVKRAILLIKDLAQKYGLEYKEISPEEEELATVTEGEKVEEKPQITSPFASFTNHEFVPFSKRIENADVSLADAYKTIRHHALCYGLKSRLSSTSDTFRLHKVTYLKIAQVGKSLKIHYALDPKAYENSTFPIKDDSHLSSYKDIPLLFKVRSDLSVKRAITLIDDLAKKNGFEYKEITFEDEVIEANENENIEIEAKEESQVSSPFASFVNHEFIPFSKRIENADSSLAEAYNTIKHEALCFGLKSRISSSSDTFRLHKKTYLKIAQVGKSLKIHYALDPKAYEDSTFPIKDDSHLSSYKDIPLLIKVRSDLSVKRAVILIHDLCEKDGLVYDENNAKEAEIPEKIEEKPIEKAFVNEKDIVSENIFASFKKNKFIPFKKRIRRIERGVRKSYFAFKNEAEELGFKSRISNSAETFRLHGERLIRVSVVGKSLKIHFALDPKDYVSSTIPVIDDSKHSSYKDIPLLIKVRSPLSGRRALILLNDLADKFNLRKDETK